MKKTLTTDKNYYCEKHAGEQLGYDTNERFEDVDTNEEEEGEVVYEED